MAIEILERGTPKAEKVFEGSCHDCKTQVRCKRSDGRFSSDQRDGDMLEVTCPVCHRPMWAYPKRTNV